MTDEYCREIESYLCRKNDGHLVRVVGPSFEIVSRWAAQGIPLKVAFSGIDRYFERYYRKGPRRRPVKIDFCDADVLDVFDEWRRAVGLTAPDPSADVPDGTSGGHAEARGPSLPAHLERAVMRLTAARASGRAGPAFDSVIDRVAQELEAARARAGGVRGDARQQLLGRLSALDDELLATARAALDAGTLAELEQQARGEIAAFRERMTADAFERIARTALDRLVRTHLALPILAFN